MTKYLLVGGAEREYESFGSELDSLIRQGVGKEPVKILACMFAKKGPGYEQSLRVWLDWYRENLPDAKVKVAEEESFTEEVAWADVVYLHGGDNKVLLESLAPYDNLGDLLSGKMVVASSAGVNALSQVFYSRTYGGVMRGLGVLPIAPMVHFGASIDDSPTDWTKAEAELREAAGDAPVIKIREGEIKIVEDN